MVDVFGSDFHVIYHGPILELFLLYIGGFKKIPSYAIFLFSPPVTLYFSPQMRYFFLSQLSC